MTRLSKLRYIKPGITLIELLVTLLIISIIVALLISAVSKVRNSAKVTEGKNKLRQLSLAYFQLDENNMKNRSSDFFKGGGLVFNSMLPYLELSNESGDYLAPPERFFLSSLDPSVQNVNGKNGDLLKPGHSDNDPSATTQKGTSSYCVNSIVSFECRNIHDISDGTSNTILFSERYANCENYGTLWSLQGSECRDGYTNKPIPCEKGDRRATFADKLYPDFLPTWDPQLQRTIGISRTLGSGKNQLFQVAPGLKQCDLNLVQSHTTAGLSVSMADGSVKVLSPQIDPSVYWSLVTPRGGEAVNID